MLMQNLGGQTKSIMHGIFRSGLLVKWYVNLQLVMAFFHPTRSRINAGSGFS